MNIRIYYYIKFFRVIPRQMRIASPTYIKIITVIRMIVIIGILSSQRFTKFITYCLGIVLRGQIKPRAWLLGIIINVILRARATCFLLFFSYRFFSGFGGKRIFRKYFRKDPKFIGIVHSIGYETFKSAKVSRVISQGLIVTSKTDGFGLVSSRVNRLISPIAKSFSYIILSELLASAITSVKTSIC